MGIERTSHLTQASLPHDPNDKNRVQFMDASDDFYIPQREHNPWKVATLPFTTLSLLQNSTTEHGSNTHQSLGHYPNDKSRVWFINAIDDLLFQKEYHAREEGMERNHLVPFCV